MRPFNLIVYRDYMAVVMVTTTVSSGACRDASSGVGNEWSVLLSIQTEGQLAARLSLELFSGAELGVARWWLDAHWLHRT